MSADVAVIRVRELLLCDFGLPAFAAGGTADLLVRRWWPQPSFRQWMGIRK